MFDDFLRSLDDMETVSELSKDINDLLFTKYVEREVPELVKKSGNSISISTIKKARKINSERFDKLLSMAISMNRMFDEGSEFSAAIVEEHLYDEVTSCFLTEIDCLNFIKEKYKSIDLSDVKNLSGIVDMFESCLITEFPCDYLHEVWKRYVSTLGVKQEDFKKALIMSHKTSLSKRELFDMDPYSVKQYFKIFKAIPLIFMKYDGDIEYSNGKEKEVKKSDKSTSPVIGSIGGSFDNGKTSEKNDGDKKNLNQKGDSQSPKPLKNPYIIDFKWDDMER